MYAIRSYYVRRLAQLTSAVFSLLGLFHLIGMLKQYAGNAPDCTVTGNLCVKIISLTVGFPEEYPDRRPFFPSQLRS